MQVQERAGRTEQESLIRVGCPVWREQVPVRADLELGDPALGVIALGDDGADSARQ